MHFAFLAAVLAFQEVDTSLPMAGVVEAYDAIVIRTDIADSGWAYSRVLFIRNRKVVAERYLNDDFVIGGSGNQWYITWRESWQPSVDRLIFADALIQFTNHHPTGDTEEWWAAGRVMTDLPDPVPDPDAKKE